MLPATEDGLSPEVIQQAENAGYTIGKTGTTNLTKKKRVVTP